MEQGMRHNLPDMNTVESMIATINNEIAVLEERRIFWEALGHRVVESMVEEQINGSNT